MAFRLRRPARGPASPPRGLNPGLVRRLESLFGEVQIANEGERAVFGPATRDPNTGRPRANLTAHGECYYVRCPYCASPKKCWVNHRYGTRDPKTGEELRSLAGCFKDCFADWENRRDFYEQVCGFAHPSVREAIFAVDESAGVEPEPVEACMPGDCTLLDALPDDHPAREYLRGRRFDPDELACDYYLSYCETAAPEFEKATGRLIIPVYIGGELVSWQARRLDGRKELKYFNMPGPKLKRFCYCIDRARRCDHLVLVEGVTNAWRIGPEAVALFGKTLSAHQERTVVSWHEEAGGPVVVALDRGAEKEREKIVERLGPRLGPSLAVLEFPDDRDAADYSRPAIRRMIAQAAPTFPLRPKRGDS